jgi:hypothetical protein
MSAPSGKALASWLASLTTGIKPANVAQFTSDNVRLGGSYKGAWGGVNLMWEETQTQGSVAIHQQATKMGCWRFVQHRQGCHHWSVLPSLSSLTTSEQTTVLSWLKLALCTTCPSVPASGCLCLPRQRIKCQLRLRRQCCWLLPVPVQPCKVCNLACVTTSNLA